MGVVDETAVPECVRGETLDVCVCVCVTASSSSLTRLSIGTKMVDEFLRSSVS